jgi:hypothetical protein
MRTTQYIGLNALALEFVATLEKLDIKHFTTGMFEEEVPLGVWKDTDGTIYKEVVQIEPWSSGPMIFTCVEVYGVKPKMWLHQWIECVPHRQHECVDFTRGTYFV